jgi:hypothetical protein
MAMPKSAAAVAFSVALGLAAFTPAEGAEKNVTVRFAKGAHFKTIKGRIAGYTVVNYLVGANDGQVMQVLFSTRKGACTMNVYEPGNNASAVHIGDTAGNEFGRNPTLKGTYRISVGMMRSAARLNEVCNYALTVELTGGMAAATGGSRADAPSASGKEQAMRDACLARTATTYAVQKTVIRLGPEMAKNAWGWALDGTVDKGAEGIKKMRCLYNPAFSLVDVMAMTPDGE